MTSRFLARLFAALISVSLLFATTPSFASVECCDPMTMAMEMSAHATAVMGTHDAAPCKMPKQTCASVCASMTSISFLTPQFEFANVKISEQPSHLVAVKLHGISRPPALPPPIALL